MTAKELALSDEEIEAIHPMEMYFPTWRLAFARAIEQAVHAKYAVRDAEAAPVAWLFTGFKPGCRKEFASVDDSDSQTWPIDDGITWEKKLLFTHPATVGDYTLVKALEYCRSALWYQIEAKFGPEIAAKYPEIVRADKAIAANKAHAPVAVPEQSCNTCKNNGGTRGECQNETCGYEEREQSDVAIRLAAIMQPYTPDAIHRASFSQLLEFLVEMLAEMSTNEADAEAYRWLRDNMYCEDSCLEIGVHIFTHPNPNHADKDQAIYAAMAKEKP